MGTPTAEFVRYLDDTFVFEVPFNPTYSIKLTYSPMWYSVCHFVIPLTEVRNIIMTGAEALIKQGIEQGARRTSIESTHAILNTRFPDADVDTLTPALEAIEDLNRLKQLNLEASVVESFSAFQERLEA